MNCEALNQIDGLQFIPVDEAKRPIPKAWQTTIKKYDLTNVVGVGLVCGEPSGSVEALDFDLKYDLTNTLFDRYKREISALDKNLLKKVVVQKTRSGGFHFIYRCSKLGGNTKLARRPTTDEEKQETYERTYKAEILKEGVDEGVARDRAKKAKDGDKNRVLIESRGLGGQVVVSPSAGYEFIFGDLCSISDITEQERDMLFSVARSFNEYFEEVSVPRAQMPKQKTDGLSPFDDYNQRGDVVGLLESHGWKIVGNKGNKTIFLRPGQTTSHSSGNFDHNKNWFSVFTTSSVFEPEKAYLPYAVFATLECDKNYSEAAKRLIEMGYGEKRETSAKEKAPSTRQIQSRINPNDDDLSFLAKQEDYAEYLHQVRTNTLPQGLTTGSPALDEYFLFKEGNFVMINGTDNVGKTKFVWYLQLLAAMYHGWKGIIFASENTLGSCIRAMIQFYWGKPLYGAYAMSDSEYEIAKNFVESHFWQIKAQEDLYNYKDIINMIKKAKAKYPEINHAMIDPYNSLKIDLSGFSKLNTHEYHYEALSEMKAFGQQNKFGFFINHHAVTAAARAKDGEKKYPIAPHKADTEGGAKVANKADDFLTIHRVTQHPTEWMITEVHVRKIKETETGGRPTPIDVPVKFEMYKGGCAFLERLEEGGQPKDPVHSWHLSREPKQQTIYPKHDTNAGWVPYKDNNGEGIEF